MEAFINGNMQILRDSILSLLFWLLGAGPARLRCSGLSFLRWHVRWNLKRWTPRDSAKETQAGRMYTDISNSGQRSVGSSAIGLFMLSMAVCRPVMGGQATTSGAACVPTLQGYTSATACTRQAEHLALANDCALRNIDRCCRDCHFRAIERERSCPPLLRQ